MSESDQGGADAGMPAVTAVISTHNRRDELRRTLALLTAEGGVELHVVVVDNASTDGTADMLRRDFPNVESIRQASNAPIPGYNLGFKAAQTPYVLVLDDDSTPAAGVLPAMVKRAEQCPHLGALAGNVVDANGRSEWDDGAERAFTDEWYNLIGCGFLIRRALLSQVDGYDEAFVLYYNDLDLALRLLAEGYRIGYSRDWTFVHRNASTGTLSPRKARMMLQNFPTVIRNHFSGLEAADLILGHACAALRQAVAGNVAGDALKGLCAGWRRTSTRSPQTIPWSPPRRCFRERFAFSSRLRRLLVRTAPRMPAETPPPDRDTTRFVSTAERNRGVLQLSRSRAALRVPRVAAAIVTYNKREAVLRLLARLRDIGVPAFVTANACSDGTAAAIREQFPEATLLDSTHNLGGCGGFNAAVLAALGSGAPYVCLIDDDALPDPDCIDRLADFLDQRPNYAFAAPAVTIADHDHLLQETGGGVVFAREVPVQAWNRFAVDPELPPVLNIDYASACTLLVRSQAIVRTGVMDWNYFIFSDDVDWSLRLRRSWGPGACVTAARASHDFPWAKPFSPMRLYYFQRNALYLFSKLRVKDPTLRSIRYTLLRILRDGLTAVCVGDREIAATLAAALRDAWQGRLGAWQSPLPFPSNRRQWTPDRFRRESIRRVLLNIHVEAYDRDALRTIRELAGNAIPVDLLCDAHRVDHYRGTDLFDKVLPRRPGGLNALRHYIQLRRHGYDLVVSDAFHEPRSAIDMAAPRSALYHDGALWEAASRPGRAGLAAMAAFPLARAASWLLAWHFRKRPQEGCPPPEAAPVLEAIGIDPAIGQPWSRPQPLPFELKPERPPPPHRRLRRAAADIARRCLSRLRLAAPPPVLPPTLTGDADPGGYWAWCKARGPSAPRRYSPRHASPPSARRKPSRKTPLFSILVPVCDPQTHWLRDCIQSVCGQSDPNWQLILCDDASRDAAVRGAMQRAAARDRRITTVFNRERTGISRATNACAQHARGDYLVFLDHDDMLDPFALAAFAERTAEADPPGVLYADEDRFDDQYRCFWPGFKPDFSPDKLLATNYIHHPVAIRRDLFERLGGLRPEYDGSQDHDLLLRAQEAGACFGHVPDVLYHMRLHSGSLVSGPQAKPEAHRRDRTLIADALRRRGIAAEVVPLPDRPGLHTIRRRPSSPITVSILAVTNPGRAAAAAPQQAARSQLPPNGWPACDVLTVDATASSLPQALNRAARRASGDVLLVTTADAVPAPGWQEALLPNVMRHDIGLVTGRIATRDGKLVACGLVLGLAGAAGAWHRGCEADEPSYGAWLEVQHEVSAVPWQLLAVRRRLLLDAGGFDESFLRAGFDIDLSLRLARDSGVRHLAVPDFRVTASDLADMRPQANTDGHDESTAGADAARLRQLWGSNLRGGDPYFNMNLSLLHEGTGFADEDENVLRAMGVLPLIQGYAK